MDILKYSAEHQAFRERLRTFLAAEVIPHADAWEKNRIVPREIWRRMGQEGFLCMDLPVEYGGSGGDFLHTLILTEEMSRTGIAGVAAALHSDVVVPYIATYGTDAQKRRYLPGCASGEIVTAVAMTEPDAGSDLAGMRTLAEEDGPDVVLNGAKTFISNGLLSDLVVVAAREAGIDNPYQGISLFIVEADRAGFKRGRHLQKMGWHSQDTTELFFTNCRIPRENRLGAKGNGFIMLMEKLQQERIVASMGAVAAAERILEWTVAFCAGHQEGGKPLSKHQAVQFAIVELTTEVKLGRTFLDKLVADHMEGLTVVVETAMAKYWTTEMVKRLADRCLDLLGPYGMLDENPIARAFRDVRVMSIFAGTNEVMKGIAAKFMGL
ncbi:MAG: acyl-CoA dehydrogenase family protein [Desulfosarcina sp.]|nr:acyl-CoA dehydrogenase family protein [Desulfobacterales bacterium]